MRHRRRNLGSALFDTRLGRSVLIATLVAKFAVSLLKVVTYPLLIGRTTASLHRLHHDGNPSCASAARRRCAPTRTTCQVQLRPACSALNTRNETQDARVTQGQPAVLITASQPMRCPMSGLPSPIRKCRHDPSKTRPQSAGIVINPFYGTRVEQTRTCKFRPKQHPPRACVMR